MINIINLQTSIADKAISAGYAIRYSMLDNISESDTFPLVIVDIDSSVLKKLADGSSYCDSEIIAITAITSIKSIGINRARDISARAIHTILRIIGLTVVENKIMYSDTIFGSVKASTATVLVNA